MAKNSSKGISMAKRNKKPARITPASAKKITAALERWSPHGLCDGTLVEKNGNPKKTEACAVGCLALEFLARDGKGRDKVFLELLNDGTFDERPRLAKDRTATIVKELLIGSGTPPNEMVEPICRFFGISDAQLGEIMDYNDGCTLDAFAGEEFPTIPKALGATITLLRQKYEKRQAKRA